MALVKAVLSSHWHHLPPGEVLALLETDAERGLDTLEVSHRQQEFGPNRLTMRKAKSPLLVFLSQFHQPLVYILLAAAAITFLLGEWVDSGVIMGVVLVNAVIGYVQETRAIKAIEALARTMEGTATVMRAGNRQQVPMHELVPGDLVLLQSGDKVPADLRLLRIRELQVDESALTGESVPAQKLACDLERDALLADRQNMAYSSTLVTYGTAAGVVVATGDNTEIGQINALIASAANLATPLTRKIADFSGVLLWLILALAAFTLLAGWLRGGPMLEAFMAAVALAVGAIPEGLPAAMTIMLAIGVGKMAQRNAIIRRMPAVETLGSTTVICSDKTGTLTRNEMTVQQVVAGSRPYHVSGVGYAPEGDVSLADARVTLQPGTDLAECLTAGVLCNDSALHRVDDQWQIEGDPTEAALLTVAAKAGLDAATLAAQLPRIDTLPFESQHQYMATLHGGDRDHTVVYLKGSVESVLKRCSHARLDNVAGVLDVDAVYREVDRLAAGGLRVLAFARKQLPGDAQSVTHAEVADGLVFLGLQAMMDPPRREAIAAVSACQAAGIQVKMITGDHLATAAAIARQIGLHGTEADDIDRFALNGHKLAAMPDDELVAAAMQTAVFARVTPEQKLRLVEALQARGQVVAMTGDGVNDAPALKQADIGVAMGVGGTEVAKEAADMVLTDDNFATIEAAVEEGRAVFDNLVKFITWTLPTNIGEGLVILVAVFAGITLPITPVQILWINMTTAVLLGLMLAFEGKEPGLMQRPPRAPGTPVLTRELALRIGFVSALLVIGAFGMFDRVLDTTGDVNLARTVAVNMFVFGELFYLFNCRSLRYSMFRLGVFTNRWLVLGVCLMVLLQLFFTYSPVMQGLFGTAPMRPVDWAWVLGGGLLIYVTIGTEKWLRRRAAA